MKRLLLLLIVVLSLAFFPRLAKAEGEITVTSDTWQNKFPQEITFKVEAKGQAEIEKITLFYTAGKDNATNYAYPASFTPGQSVTAEFSLKTNGRSFIPPGTDIDYYYSIQDKSGKELKTERTSITYMDTRFEWQKMENETVAVYWHGPVQSQAQVILQAATKTVAKMGKVEGVTPTHPFKIFVYNSKPEIDVALPFQSETTRRELITQGQAWAEYDLLLMIGTDPGVQGIAEHEVTHWVTHQATDNAFSPVPAWLNEGLSVWAEEDASHQYEEAVNLAIRQDRLLPVKSLATVPGKPQDVILFYGEAHSLVKFLIDNNGEEKMRALLRAFKEGSSEEKALQATYGFGRDELDSRWRASVGLAPRAATPQEPTAVPRAAPNTPVPQSPKPAESAGPPSLVYVLVGLIAVVALALAGLLGATIILLRRSH